MAGRIRITIPLIHSSLVSSCNNDPRTYSILPRCVESWSAVAQRIYVGLLTIFLCSNAHAVPVGGIIDADTNWSNASEAYEIAGSVQIAPGVTLTIGQGVTVTNGDIVVFGTLEVHGTAPDPVHFEGVNVVPGSNSSSMDQPFHMNIDHASFQGGSIYTASPGASYGSLSLTNSVITNCPFMYIWYPVSDVLIEGNIFESSGGISVGTNDGIQVIIRGNRFVAQSTDYAVSNWASYGTSRTIVEFNDFVSTDRIALELPSGYSNTAITGINNWWGTTNESVIQSMIFDRNDDLSSSSYISYKPYLSEPVTLPIFDDVQEDHWAFSFVEALARAGITGGCGGSNYCPMAPVTRAQMAVFLERGMNGSSYSPPPASGNLFLDVGADSFAANFIEQLFLDGITGGCGSNNYCPDNQVTRAQMAVFLLRAKHGASYSPPAPSGVFGDVDLGHWAVAWVEQLAAEGITGGCGDGDFCPESPVTRAQMAVFLVKAFGL